MDCCQSYLTTYIIKEAMLMRGQTHGKEFSKQMLEGAAIDINNPEDLEILKSIGQEAIDMMNDFFPPKNKIMNVKCLNEEGKEIELPDYLKEDSKFLICDKCGRKSWSLKNIDTICNMTQPDGIKCEGIFKI